MQQISFQSQNRQSKDVVTFTFVHVKKSVRDMWHGNLQHTFIESWLTYLSVLFVCLYYTQGAICEKTSGGDALEIFYEMFLLR